MKKRKIWGICCVLFAAMLLIFAAPKATAYAEGSQVVIPEGFVLRGEFWKINPYYAEPGEETSYFSRPTLVELTEEETLAGEGTFCDTVENAVTYLREQMTKRAASIVFTMSLDDSSGVSALFDTIYNRAQEHTGNSKEGDYISHQFGTMSGAYSASSSYSYSLGRYEYKVTFTMNFTFYTDLAQENEVDAAVTAFRTDNIQEGMTDYQKVKAIHDFICRTVTYDYNHLNDTNYKLQYTAYAALINHTAVCQGYALLFYRLCLEEGIDVRYMFGTGNGGGHGWNIVKIGNYYYNIDCTWDENISNKHNPDNIIINYTYFLRSDANFADHKRDDELTGDEFYCAYPMSASDYNPEAEPAAPEIAAHSLVLDGMIGVNFFVTPNDGDLTNAYMEFDLWAKNETYSIPLADASRDKLGRYKFTCYVNSISMADNIHAKFSYNDDNAFLEDNYTVVEYLMKIAKSNDSSNNLKKLAKAIFNYGYYSQQLAGNDGRVTTPMTGEPYTDPEVNPLGVDAFDWNTLSAMRASDVSKVTASLTLNAATVINIYFTTASEAFDVSVSNLGTCKTNVTRLDDNRIQLQITNIPAHRLGDDFEVTAITAGGDTTVKVSALSYARAVIISSDSDAEKNCMGSLGTYYKSTTDYAQAPNS